jgi:hypothetical protein
MELTLNKGIFTEKLLKRAMDDFADLADIKVENKNNQWILYFLNCRYGQEKTIREFENYLIGLENL